MTIKSGCAALSSSKSQQSPSPIKTRCTRFISRSKARRTWRVSYRCLRHSSSQRPCCTYKSVHLPLRNCGLVTLVLLVLAPVPVPVLVLAPVPVPVPVLVLVLVLVPARGKAKDGSGRGGAISSP